MTEIIPSIIAKDFGELRERVEEVENYVKWVQLDVSDGDFAPNPTWNDPIQLKYYDPGVFMEAHLMIAKPEKDIAKWIDSGVKRIYFHYEATSARQEIIDKIKNAKLEAGIALLPETPVSVIDSLKNLDAVLLFSGKLGFYGGKFDSDKISPRIRALRDKYPSIKIEIDGGMNTNTVKDAVRAGANLIISGSYIFESKDVQKAIEKLKETAMKENHDKFRRQ